jgi:hypothetical protein
VEQQKHPFHRDCAPSLTLCVLKLHTNQLTVGDICEGFLNGILEINFKKTIDASDPSVQIKRQTE